jgi:GT2 family glycosyltransferase
MDISVVIPNYNGKDLLAKNLPEVIIALKDYQGGKKEIIIVDDASTDNSVEYLSNLKSSFDPELRTEGQISNLKLIKNEKNLGFSLTVNKGVEEANGEVVVLLNTDVCPEKDFLLPLLRHFENPKTFAVGCLDKSIEGEEIVLRGRGLGRWQRGLLVHRKGEVDKTDTLWVSGGSAAFRKSIWDHLGGLNKLYSPFYYEDIDLSYRALKSGYDICFEPNSVVVHEHEKGAIKTRYSAKRIKRIAYRNQFLFVWLNVTDLSLQLLSLIWLPYHLTKAVLRLDKEFILGFFDALILLPNIIKSKVRNKKYFIRTDKEIISNLSV